MPCSLQDLSPLTRNLTWAWTPRAPGSSPTQQDSLTWPPSCLTPSLSPHCFVPKASHFIFQQQKIYSVVFHLHYYAGYFIFASPISFSTFLLLQKNWVPISFGLATLFPIENFRELEEREVRVFLSLAFSQSGYGLAMTVLLWWRAIFLFGGMAMCLAHF